MPRRSSLEIAQEHEAKAARYRADADRRRSVASDNGCSLMWDAEKALRALAAYMGAEGATYEDLADNLKEDREARWQHMKSIMDKAKEQQ